MNSVSGFIVLRSETSLSFKMNILYIPEHDAITDPQYVFVYAVFD
jgi:hypothetical protein